MRKYSIKHEIANLFLWLLTAVTTALIVPEELSKLGPLYAICAIGSTVIIRHLRIAENR